MSAGAPLYNAVIYSFHFYHPHEYTHMRRPEGQPPAEYPGRWGREALAVRLSNAVRFRARHQVPVYCGEWGVQTGAPGYQQWLKDVAGLLEEHKFPWTHWAWALQRGDPVNDTFDCNRQKTEIYGLLGGIFNEALRRQAAPTENSVPRPINRGWNRDQAAVCHCSVSSVLMNQAPRTPNTADTAVAHGRIPPLSNGAMY